MAGRNVLGADRLLFRQGDRAEAFYLLTGGAVTLQEAGGESFVLHPLSIIGELGALTGRLRNSTAEAAMKVPLPSESTRATRMRRRSLAESGHAARHQGVRGVVDVAVIE